MLTAFLQLVSTDAGISLLGAVVLISWLLGAVAAVCFGVLPLRARYQALVTLAAAATQQRDDAKAHIEALHRDANMKAQMYLHGLQLARRVDASHTDRPVMPRKGAA
jgi:hypothetical protein